MEKFDQFTVVKYGTDVLTMECPITGRVVDDGNVIDGTGAAIDSVPDQRIVLVSSGGVGMGRSIAGNTLDYIRDKDVKKRILAGVGNPKLSLRWQTALQTRLLVQALITDKTDEGEAQKILRELYREPGKTLLQVNGNDIDSPDEMHRDNDRNAKNIALYCKALASNVRLLVGTKAEGFCENFNTKNEQLMDIRDLQDLTVEYLDKHCGKGTKGGTGNMKTKMLRLIEAVEGGVDECVIFNGKDPQNLKHLLDGRSVGTKIIRSHNLTEV